MESPQHNYSRINEMLAEQGFDLLTLTHHLTAIGNHLCVDFHELPVGSRSEYMKHLSCLLKLNGALQDIIVDEYYTQAQQEEEDLSLNA